MGRRKRARRKKSVLSGKIGRKTPFASWGDSGLGDKGKTRGSLKRAPLLLDVQGERVGQKKLLCPLARNRAVQDRERNLTLKKKNTSKEKPK